MDSSLLGELYTDFGPVLHSKMALLYVLMAVDFNLKSIQCKLG